MADSAPSAAEQPPGPSKIAAVIDGDAALREEFQLLEHGADEARAALCLSGGGIRSAAFSLGVMQALARRGLLAQFHYVSSVSGGGYAAAWLTRLIATMSRGTTSLDLAEVETRLWKREAGAESQPIRNLRRYSNYLTPSPGLLSFDTWAGLMLWLRNTLINWFVFLPVFGLVSGLPILYLAGACALIDNDSLFGLHLQYAALAFLLIAVVGSIIRLPSHAHPDKVDAAGKAEFGLRFGPIFVQIVVPIVLWCLLAPLAAMTTMPDGHDPKWTLGTRIVFERYDPPPVPCPPVKGQVCPMPSHSADPAAPSQTKPSKAATLPLRSFGVCLAGYFLAFLIVAFRNRGDATLLKRHTSPFLLGLLPWLASSGLSALVLYAAIRVAEGQSLFWAIVAGPLVVCIAEILRTTLYIALRQSGLRSDSDREWLARVNGVKIMVVLGMACGGAIILVGGPFLPRAGTATWSAIIGGGVASGSVAALLARSAQTAWTQRADVTSRVPRGVLIKLGIVLFIMAIAVVIGRGVALAIGAIARAVAPAGPEGPTSTAIFFSTIGVLAFLALTAWLLGRVIVLNRFSMHAVYRNRLIRAFLGSAREWAERRPDRFTQFDPTDNLRIADSFTARKQKRLFHVVNVALNRTTGSDSARAERKAESFTITPFRCGGPTLVSPPSPDGTCRRAGAYAPTQGYACGERDTGAFDEEKGISLGTAITISGAAASPNMGYHSSPLTAFVMTLFNMRLGAWLPNPGLQRFREKERRDMLRRSGPVNEVPTLLKELLGRSDIDGDFLYLSDGGHFDNLGLYEMLRRRCRFMLVVDAGQDKSYAYEDLARVMRHARIDLGIEIAFDPAIEFSKSDLPDGGALATVVYPALKAGSGGEVWSGERGRIIYLKSHLPKEPPIELASSRSRREHFPHEPTGNQFYTESDFESYRRLGEEVATRLLAGAAKSSPTGPVDPAAMTMAELFGQSEASDPPRTEDLPA